MLSVKIQLLIAGVYSGPSGAPGGAPPPGAPPTSPCFFTPDTMSSILRSNIAVCKKKKQQQRDIRNLYPQDSIWLTKQDTFNDIYLNCSFVRLDFDGKCFPDSVVLHVHHLACLSVHAPARVTSGGMLRLGKTNST